MRETSTAPTAHLDLPGRLRQETTLLPIGKVAKYFAVSDTTVRAWMKLGAAGIPYAKLAGTFRFDPIRVAAWLDANTENFPEQEVA